MSFSLISVSRKKWDLFVVSPSDDMYYRWLFVIAMAVLYNWFIVVARWSQSQSSSCFCCPAEMVDGSSKSCFFFFFFTFLGHALTSYSWIITSAGWCWTTCLTLSTYWTLVFDFAQVTLFKNCSFLQLLKSFPHTQRHTECLFIYFIFLEILENVKFIAEYQRGVGIHI